MKSEKILIIGGTGMLTPLCNAIAPHNLILAARFKSNLNFVNKVDDATRMIPLDYMNNESQKSFFREIDSFTDIAACVLWVHSKGHSFSQSLINYFARRQDSPKIIHVFGSAANRSSISDFSIPLSILFDTVALGSVRDGLSTRWMNHLEISEMVADSLRDIIPINVN